MNNLSSKMQEMRARREEVDQQKTRKTSKLGEPPKPEEAAQFEHVEQIPTHKEVAELKKQADEVPQKPAPRRKKPLERVQKNLSILKTDAARMVKIANRDDLSQAMLINAMLDLYETTNK